MSDFHALDAYLDNLYQKKNIPGAAIRVYQHGKLLHTHCAGYADVEKGLPFDENTLVNLYSATKLSTVVAAMRLCERGILALDTPVSRWLPGAAKMTVRQTDGSLRPAQQPMLIRHLFSMSAGFSYEMEKETKKQLMEETDGRPTTAQVVHALLKDPLLFEPGTRFQYSFCHDVLGAVIEAATSQPFSKVLEKEIFEPLKMTETSFHLRPEQQKRMALEYRLFDGKTGKAQSVYRREGVDMGFGPSYESGGGGLISSVRDYGRLACALANRGVAANGFHLLRQESIAQMQENQLTAMGMNDFAAMGGWSKAGYGYGLGVRTLLWPERNNALSAQGEFGWDGAHGCYFLADPTNGIGLFYAQQEDGSRWYEFHGHIRNLVYAGILMSQRRMSFCYPCPSHMLARICPTAPRHNEA